jgi:hypothetical protein
MESNQVGNQRLLCNDFDGVKAFPLVRRPRFFVRVEDEVTTFFEARASLALEIPIVSRILCFHWFKAATVLFVWVEVEVLSKSVEVEVLSSRVEGFATKEPVRIKLFASRYSVPSTRH